MNLLSDSSDSAACSSPMSFDGVVIFNVIVCGLGLLWAYRNVKKVTNIKLDNYS